MLRRIGIIGLILAAFVPPAPCTPTTVRVSADPPLAADYASTAPSVSADGRYVAFASAASNLVPNDTNGGQDVFLRDTVTGVTSRMSVALDGAQVTGQNGSPSLSGDGRRVAFVTAAKLLASDTNGNFDIYVRDTASGRFWLIARPPTTSSSSEPVLNGDGRWVAFGNNRQVYAAEVETGLLLRVSESTAGGPPNGNALEPTISASGRFVAFTSVATNLVAGDTNGVDDIFLRDLQAGTTVRVSTSSQGAQADRACSASSISADGLKVAFQSQATNLGGKPSGANNQVFVKDVAAGTVKMVSVGPDGIGANYPCYSPRLSADGRKVAFRTAATNLVPGETTASTDVFVVDAGGANMTRVSMAPGGVPPNGASGDGGLSINGDGSTIAYASLASNLAPGDANGVADIFLARPTAPPLLVSAALPGGHCYRPSLSADGSRVAWERAVTASLPIWDSWVLDRNTAILKRVWASPKNPGPRSGNCLQPCVTGTAGVVWYSSNSGLSGGLPGAYLVFRSDAYVTQPVKDGGPAGWPSAALNGSVAWQSESSGVVTGDTNGVADIFVLPAPGATVRASVTHTGAQSNGPSYEPSLSFDGNAVAFISTATNLVAADANGLPDVFVRDLSGRRTVRASVAWDGTETDGPSGPGGVSCSGSGRYVAFVSQATNLVPDDRNGLPDVFVRDTLTGTTVRISVAPGTAEANGASERPSISADGRFVAFRSLASNLVADDGNGVSDVFVRDLATGTTTRVSVAANGAEANGESAWPCISADGRWVTFESMATNLVAGDANGVRDVYVRGPFTAPYQYADLVRALRFGGGLEVSYAQQSGLLDVAAPAGVVNLLDAVAIARKVAGLEPNP